MDLEEATKVRVNMAKEQKDHGYDIMNRPADVYDFNIDDLNDGDFPRLPNMQLGSSSVVGIFFDML